ncbi:MAG: CAP domain-containing protein [Acutalibacteraceae bacterium]|nr:CAP domain-containing protein [Acutalibacteraceae bacterium]
MSNKKNVITIAVAVVALMLTLVVVLIATGVINFDNLFSGEPATVVESEVVVVSQTNEQGEVEYVTIVTKYYKPDVQLHKYPTKPTTKGTTATTVRYLEQSSYLYMTDPDGSISIDENGNPVTEIVTYTVREDSITTAPPRTSAVAVTGTDGVQQTDANGNPVTEVVTYYEPTTTAPDRWSTTQEGTTRFNPFPSDIKKDEALANNIIAEINDERVKAGLEPLEASLNGAARTNSQNMAQPEIFGGKLYAPDSYMLESSYGGNSLYLKVSSSNQSKIMSADTTKIGVGIVVRDGIYYTTVIFG